MSFKYTCSLGPHFHSSFLLKNNNLKKESYPFDWIFTNHNIIKQILDNNFINFLDKTQYIHLNNSQAGHSLYHDSMFWHHNPLNNNEHYEYFVRCVNRFKEMIKHNEEKLFVYLVKDVKEIEEETFTDDMIQLNDTLKQYTTNFKLLVIIIYPNKIKNNYITKYVDNIDFFYIDTLSTSNGKEFINNKDNKYLSIILNVKYKFELKNVSCLERAEAFSAAKGTGFNLSGKQEMKIISIGCNCDVGFFIKNNFNSEYYPFDWIWSNIDFVINTFEKDYFEFTDCEKLNAVWVPPNKNTYIFNNNCKGDKERICSAISLHDADFQTQDQYISNIPLINEKYKRRFKRLYDVLNHHGDIILIRKVLDKSQGAVKKNFDTNEKINYLSDLLSKKFKANITICIVDNEDFINENIPLNNNIKLFNTFNELGLFIKSAL